MNEQYRRTDDDETDSNIAVSDMEWENRQLCDDGTCIGVIGLDGRCRQCGRPQGENRGKWLPATDADEMDAKADQQEDDPADDALNGGDPDWASRILCGDGTCIGVIGPDGICKACGKPLETTAAGSLEPSHE